jgi:hypothetical protein
MAIGPAGHACMRALASRLQFASLGLLSSPAGLATSGRSSPRDWPHSFLQVTIAATLHQQDPTKCSKAGKANVLADPEIATKAHVLFSPTIDCHLKEKPMLKFLMSTLLSLAWTVPVLAQETPKDPPFAPNAAPDQSDSLADATKTIQQLIQERLASAGFTDVQMIPNSFLIIAKDRDGRFVTMTASPSSVTESDDSGPAQDNNDMRFGPSPPAGLIEEM